MSDAAARALMARLEDRGLDLWAVKAALWARQIETAGWCFTATGSRFFIHPSPGAARNVWEKLEDAATVHCLSGVAEEVAINTLVDLVDVDIDEVAQFTRSLGIRIGSLVPNIARDGRFRFGALTHEDASIREAAIGAFAAAAAFIAPLGATALSMWLPDGTHYPGQADFIRRKQFLEMSLAQIGAAMPPGFECLLEYKNFEPAPYHTDIADWGMAALLARKAGPQFRVLLDFGHHAHGTNIPHILAFLADEGLLGGLHLNDRHSADDDLTLGSINPYMMFLSMAELSVRADVGSVRFGLDQHHTVKQPLLATLDSVCRAQELYLKTLLIDRAALRRCQSEHDTIGAESVLREAFGMDVAALLGHWRAERGLPRDPVLALRTSGLLEKNQEKRG